MLLGGVERDQWHKIGCENFIWSVYYRLQTRSQYPRKDLRRQI